MECLTLLTVGFELGFDVWTGSRAQRWLAGQTWNRAQRDGWQGAEDVVWM